MSTKAERKELQKPDEFQTQGSRAMRWIIERKNLLIGVGVVAVLVVIGVWAASEYQAGQEAKAGAALSSALAMVARPTMGDPGGPLNWIHIRSEPITTGTHSCRE